MKIINFSILLLLSFLLFSCSKVTEPVKKISIGTSQIKYQSDEQVESLIIPPDLTKPNSNKIFSEKVTKVDKEITYRNNNVEVKRDKYRRWLLVDLSPNEAWTLSKDFFRSFGFIIEKENEQVGIFETDFLEKETIVPEKSLGPIRAALSKALKTSYGMPTADKYRIRIEPLEDPGMSEVYLTLSSIGEVVSGEMRVWQPKEKNLELETEMLLSLMVFIGSDEGSASKKIQDTDELDTLPLKVITSENGYASLVFPYNKVDSWKLLGWALDELGEEISDRDSIDGSYYIKVTPDKGFFSKLINTMSSISTYQLYIREVNGSQSELYFVDLSQENSQSSIDYSFKLFEEISSKF